MSYTPTNIFSDKSSSINNFNHGYAHNSYPLNYNTSIHNASGAQANDTITYSYPVKPFYTSPILHRTLSVDQFAFLKIKETNTTDIHRYNRALPETQTIVHLPLLNYLLAEKSSKNDDYSVENVFSEWSPVGVVTNNEEHSRYSDYVVNLTIRGKSSTYDLWPKSQSHHRLYFMIYQKIATENLVYNIGTSSLKTVHIPKNGTGTKIIQVKPCSLNPMPISCNKKAFWLCGTKETHRGNVNTDFRASSFTSMIKRPKCTIFVNGMC
jgi:hypothetical protein